MTYTNAPEIRRQYGVGWLTEAWEIFRLAPGTWILTMIAVSVIQSIVNQVIELPFSNPFETFRAALHHETPPTTQPWQWALYPFIMAAQMFVSAFFNAGYMKMAIAAMRRQPVRIEDVFSGWPITLKMFGYAFLQLLFSAVAIVLPVAAITLCFTLHAAMPVTIGVCVVCGILALAGIVYYTFVIIGDVTIADGAGPVEAFRRIFTTMRPHHGAVLGVIVLMDLLIIASVCTLCTGFLVTIPMFFILAGLIGRDTLGIAGAPDSPDRGWLPPGSEMSPGAWPPPPTA